MRQNFGIIVAVAFLIIGLVDYCLLQNLNDISSRYSSWVSVKKPTDRYAAGKYHERLVSVLDLPSVSNPVFSEMHPSIQPEDVVIGIVVDGTAIAFPVSKMSSPDDHVVHFSMDETDVTVTHCNISGCSRVLTRNEENPTESSNVQVGGLQENGEMVLLIDGVRYSHLSESVPLKDLDFQMTSLDHWECEHPDSLFYMGEKSIPLPMTP